MRNSPNHDAPHENVPEDVEKQQQEKRRKDLVLHPPCEPDALARREELGVGRDQVELVPYGPECEGAEVDAEVAFAKVQSAGCEGFLRKFTNRLTSR